MCEYVWLQDTGGEAVNISIAMGGRVGKCPSAKRERDGFGRGFEKALADALVVFFEKK